MHAIQPVSRESAGQAERAVFDLVQKRFGSVVEPVAVSAHSPAVLEAVMGFERAIARVARLPERLVHLVNLKAAALLGCSFCIDIGSHLALAGGVTRAMLRDLPAYRESPEFTAAERAALAAAEAMTLGNGEIDDALWPLLRAHFDDAALVELFAVIAWENYRSRFNRAAGLTAQGFCPLESRAAAESPAARSERRSA